MAGLDSGSGPAGECGGTGQGAGVEGTRFLEIRGEAEQAAELIRIRPRRLVSWNIDPGSPGLHTVNVDAG
jgi:pyridoxamine 5'-phosphate oxidase family protein